MESSHSILHFCGTYLNRTETFIHRFVEKSRALGPAHVVTWKFIENELLNESSRSAVHELSGRCYPLDSVSAVLRAAEGRLRGPRWIREIAALLEQLRPSIVHCHFGPLGLDFLDAVRRVRRPPPWVVSFYGMDASQLPQTVPAYRARLAELWQGASGFLVEGPALGEKLALLGAPREKIHVNPLIVPIRQYPQKASYADLEKQIRFLLIGRFIPKKGFHLFFEAVGRLQAQMPPFHIAIVGDGPLRAQYEEILVRWNLREKVEFLGFRPHEECLKLMIENDIFVHPSATAPDGDSEGGAPTIMIEAQAVGIPVLASTHADIPFVMGYDDFLAQEGSIDSLAQKLAVMIHCPDLAILAERGRKKVLEQHDFDHKPSAYCQTLLKIIEGLRK